MKILPGQINLMLAWLWILLGFVSGMVLGMFFHGENWLGGYASFKRRMYRLGHISFFGLGAVNLLFYFTAKSFPSASPLIAIASWAFVVGALSMPVCSVLMADFPKAHLLFAVPVVSLIAGGVLTLMLIVDPVTRERPLHQRTYPPAPSSTVNSAKRHAEATCRDSARAPLERRRINS